MFTATAPWDDYMRAVLNGDADACEAGLAWGFGYDARGLTVGDVLCDHLLRDGKSTNENWLHWFLVDGPEVEKVLRAAVVDKYTQPLAVFRLLRERGSGLLVAERRLLSDRFGGQLTQALASIPDPMLAYQLLKRVRGLATAEEEDALRERFEGRLPNAEPI